MRVQRIPGPRTPESPLRTSERALHPSAAGDRTERHETACHQQERSGDHVVVESALVARRRAAHVRVARVERPHVLGDVGGPVLACRGDGHGVLRLAQQVGVEEGAPAGTGTRTPNTYATAAARATRSAGRPCLAEPGRGATGAGPGHNRKYGPQDTHGEQNPTRVSVRGRQEHGVVFARGAAVRDASVRLAVGRCRVDVHE